MKQSILAAFAAVMVLGCTYANAQTSAAELTDYQATPVCEVKVTFDKSISDLQLTRGGSQVSACIGQAIQAAGDPKKVFAQWSGKADVIKFLGETRNRNNISQAGLGLARITLLVTVAEKLGVPLHNQTMIVATDADLGDRTVVLRAFNGPPVRFRLTQPQAEAIATVTGLEARVSNLEAGQWTVVLGARAGLAQLSGPQMGEGVASAFLGLNVPMSKNVSLVPQFALGAGMGSGLLVEGRLGVDITLGRFDIEPFVSGFGAALYNHDVIGTNGEATSPTDTKGRGFLGGAQLGFRFSDKASAFVGGSIGAGWSSFHGAPVSFNPYEVYGGIQYRFGLKKEVKK